MPKQRGSRVANKNRATQRQHNDSTSTHRPEHSRSEESQNRRSLDHIVIHKFSKLDVPNEKIREFRRELIIGKAGKRRFSAEVLLRAEAETETFHKDGGKFSGTSAGKGIMRSSCS